MEKFNKLSLPVVILIASIILGGFIFASQVIKQKSIEGQQKLELEQEYKEYVAKRKGECYDIYVERDKLRNNVDGYFYDEKNDVCKVRYENKKWKEGDPNSCQPLEKLTNKDSKCTIEPYFTKEY